LDGAEAGGLACQFFPGGQGCWEDRRGLRSRPFRQGGSATFPCQLVGRRRFQARSFP
jgi:hypothetical protein